jgi:hypothetical protein
MANKWITAAPGIRYRQHPHRKHGARLDRYYRGRDGHYWPPPAQIRTRPTKASGSYLGCLTSKRSSGQG